MPQLKNRRRERFAVEIAAMTPYDRAYVAAGYKDTPWARYNASRLAHEPEVAERINELRAAFSERSQIHAEYLQRLLLPIAEANLKDCYTLGPDGKECLRPITELPRALTSAIAKVDHDETGAVKSISLHGKIAALTVLLRSVGGLLERHDHSHSGKLEIQPFDPSVLTDEQLHTLEDLLLLAAQPKPLAFTPPQSE